MAQKIYKKIIILYNYIVVNLCMLFYINLRSKNRNNLQNITTIIFSFDRPLQLACLLDTINRYQQHSRTVIIIYRTSSADFFKSYQAIFERFREGLTLHLFHENKMGFRKNLMDAIRFRRSSHYLFYVDDQVVLSHLPEAEITEGLKLADIFTYRLGLNTRYCYTLDKIQKIKKYSSEKQVITWSMTLEKNDLNYAFSLDGTALPAELVDAMVNWMYYIGPNSFESSMNYSNRLSILLGLKISAPYNQKCINFVLGRVQHEVENRSLCYDVKFLHDLFLKGYQIRAVKNISKFMNSPHSEKGFEFIKQNQ